MVIPAIPTKEHAIPPIRMLILYIPEGSPEELDFQLSVISYTTSFIHNNDITNDTINNDIEVADTLLIK